MQCCAACPSSSAVREEDAQQLAAACRTQLACAARLEGRQELARTGCHFIDSL